MIVNDMTAPLEKNRRHRDQSQSLAKVLDSLLMFVECKQGHTTPYCNTLLSF